jgi:hypothetical protein
MTGRPVKRSADWFPHDGHASDQSKTITILENHFGAEGYMAWFKLLERLSTTENHIITCRNVEDAEFLAAKLKLSPERFEQILGKMAELDGIDRDLWRERTIWCQNLVDRLAPVYQNRKQELPHKPLVTTTDKPISRLETPISTTDNTQREVVERGSRESTPIIPQWVSVLCDFKHFEYNNGWPQEIETSYPGIDLLDVAREFVDYWSERRKEIKSMKATWRNRLKDVAKRTVNHERVPATGYTDPATLFDPD